ncbi:MAG: chromosomal replication initiator protein DnaA [Candidatus Zixiibacteriota bacterium]
MILQETISNSAQWQDCLDYIRKRVKEQQFATWLKPTKGEPNGNGIFKIGTPNQFVADWIRDNFGHLIEESFRDVLGREYEMVFVVTGSNENDDQTSLPLFEHPAVPAAPPPRGSVNPNLDNRYSFDSLVVGDFNQFACAASMAVAEAPGMTKYNPLYIYGGTGLGKTHIVQAIGRRILEQYPQKRVIYATSEKFTSDFIASISDRAISDFTRVYRDVDTLIIDDIQFFSGKESTQEQFFHTFNTLYHFGKQIILTSDRPPKEIKGLEERLLSRFTWGLVTDLQAPDLEGRTAIIYKKLQTLGLSMPEAVTTYIADRSYDNIRDLEGALIRIFAFASMKSAPVDLEMARKVLSDYGSQQRKEVTIDSIQKKVADHFNVEAVMLKAKKKSAEIVVARHVAMYLARSLTKSSLKLIGNAFGGRDHSTVIHACDLVDNKMANDPGFREKIDKISASLLY